MPSASINNQSSTKLVKQTSVNSVNSGGASGTSKVNKKISESSTKSNNTTNTTTVINLSNETSSLKTAKENTNNVVAAAQQQNNKNWETSSATGINTSGGSGANKDAGNDALNPMKLTFTTIEHKIRNLEKRKTKLEGYLNSGKELNSEQRAAVAKYDAVMATLEFARDLVKQMQQFTKDAEKEQKKQVRKELIAKAQAETIKIREVLIIQNILSCFTDDAVRNDFVSGENGAAKLEPAEIEILEKFCLDVQTRRPETSEDVPFATSAQKAAEIFSMTIDARPKQYGDTTYENVKRVFHRIQESDYLDKIYLTDVPEPEIKTVDDVEHEANVDVEDTPVAEGNKQEQEAAAAADENLAKVNVEAQSAPEAAPVVENNANALDQQQQQQAIIKEHLEVQQQVTLTSLPPPTAQAIIPTPMAPPATAVPSFQPTVPAPHSGATTPVHVAIYHPSLQQPAPQHLQQIANNAALIGGVHTHNAAQILPNLTAQQLQQAGVQNLPPSSVQSNQTQQQQQRQLLTSPAPGQPGVAAGPIAMHNGTPQQQSLPPGHFNPTPVHAVEQNFFKHQTQHAHQQPPPPQQQYLQQMRPLAEVIGSGNFYFLQDSELDSPDLNSQAAVPQNTIVFEQQQQQQQPHPNKPTQHVLAEQTVATQNQQQLQQLNQQLPLNQPQNSTPTPIQTQTFTNQSFPQMPPPQQQQQQQPAQQPQQHPSNTSLMQSNTPSPLFQQPPPPPQQQQQQQHQTQQQQQQKATNNQQQIYSPVQNQNLITPQQQQQSQLIMAAANETPQQPPPNIMMLNRLAAAGDLMQQQQQGLLQQQQQQQQQIAPQTQNLVTSMQQQLPPNSAAADLSQTPKNTGFPFDNSVVSGIGYEQQMQNKLNAEKVLNAFQEANNIAATHLHKNDLINEWDEAVLKSNNSPSASSQQDYKAAGSVQAVETTSHKWSAEVNANSPITIQQNSSRKNEWTSSAANSNSGIAAESSGGGYVNDNSRPESNHWHSQDSNNYGRGSSGGNRGQGSGAATGGYQRQRNDDRRDDRRPGGGSGGGGGGGYRGRSNYGSGNPQQNGQSRGGGGGGGGNSSGIYFRNNENSNNSYYQNGNGGGGGGGGGGSNVYSNKDSRYESRGGGGGNYRGPRGSDSSANPRSNGPPPRHMGNRTSGGNVNNTNSNSYMSSRQSNRMPLGIENKN